jgi:hypothetical protein
VTGRFDTALSWRARKRRGINGIDGNDETDDWCQVCLLAPALDLFLACYGYARLTGLAWSGTNGPGNRSFRNVGMTHRVSGSR